MILAARHRSYSRLDNSPVASGWSRSCSMMKRSIVMTDVDVCTLAIGRKGDSARLIRSEDLTAPTRQPVEHLGCRMAVMIVRAYADHSLARPQRQLLDHRGEPAQVVGVAVRRHDEREPPGAVPPQEGDHDAPPRVAPGNSRASVNHDPAAVGRTENCGVSLPYVKKTYRQTTALVEGDNVPERRRDENRDQKRCT